MREISATCRNPSPPSLAISPHSAHSRWQWAILVARSQGLLKTDAWVLITLALHADYGWVGPVPVATLMAQAFLSERTTRRALATLEAKGIVRRELGEGRYAAKRYEIVADWGRPS